jgi:pimeloyl-ACP methyl ester carboxylesterase
MIEPRLWCYDAAAMSASSTRVRRGPLWRIALAAALCVVAAAARAETKLGIVLMHGKLGVPLGVSVGPGPAIGAGLIAALKSAGYLVAVPEMCWSRRRGFDKPFDECLREVDQAVAALKADGATEIVVGGQSLGGNAAIAYGATRAGLRGIIGLAPADDPVRKANRREIAASLARAHELVASGKGDVPDTFSDVNTGAQGTFPMVVNTTPRIFLSFFDPQSGRSIADNVAKLTAPLLWVAGSEDPTQRDAETYFQRVAPNPLNRYVAVTANHLTTADAGRDGVLAWLAALEKR